MQSPDETYRGVEDKTLDLLLTNSPPPVNRVKGMPPIGKADHDIVYIEYDIKRIQQAPRKIFLFKRADRDGLRDHPMGEITVDPNGVLKLLNNLKIHKAPGPDGLSARVLKDCSSEIAPTLALIYNETLAQGTVPDDWRQANVAPIFKKGEKYDAANFRPVSLTCICCKTLEHILVSNINKHLAFESFLADCQHESEVRGPAKPNWFNSSMIWLAIWIVH